MFVIFLLDITLKVTGCRSAQRGGKPTAGARPLFGGPVGCRVGARHFSALLLSRTKAVSGIAANMTGTKNRTTGISPPSAIRSSERSNLLSEANNGMSMSVSPNAPKGVRMNQTQDSWMGHLRKMLQAKPTKMQLPEINIQERRKMVSALSQPRKR